MYQTIYILKRSKFLFNRLQKSNMKSIVFHILHFYYTYNSIQNIKTYVSNVTFATVPSPISIKQNIKNINSIFNIPQLNNPASSNMDSYFMVSTSRLIHSPNDLYAIAKQIFCLRNFVL